MLSDFGINLLKETRLRICAEAWTVVLPEGDGRRREMVVLRVRHGLRRLSLE